MIFQGLYNTTMQWAAHRHAERYLAFVSFIESIFFPVPTAMMLAPMAMAKPDRAVRLAIIATLTSVGGGVLGYFIGAFAMDMVEPLLVTVGYIDKYHTAVAWFTEWGFWAVIIAGFSPIPFKLFTLSAGALNMALLPFILAALLGRSAHFFMVALLMAWAGPKMEPTIKKYIEWIGWLMIVVVLIIYFFIKK
ncbi:MAG: DedA family protein [Gammaproteobacteria bacterium]|nr:DedA family protein [Gammaproteobacteria bacterium]